MDGRNVRAALRKPLYSALCGDDDGDDADDEIEQPQWPAADLRLSAGGRRAGPVGGLRAVSLPFVPAVPRPCVPCSRARKWSGWMEQDGSAERDAQLGKTLTVSVRPSCSARGLLQILVLPAVRIGVG